MTEKVQVLVAGAGPVGLTLAAELKRFGVNVRIVDKAPAPTDKSKALVLWSRSLELLERTGKIADYLAAGQPGHGTRISKGRELIAEIDLDGIDSPYPYALMIPQNETERVLGETLAGFGGAVERQVELVAFEDGPNGVTATLKHPDDRLEQVTADWLVGCDGAHSTVRHGLGLPFEGSTQPSDWVLADLKVEGLKPDKLDLYWHAEGVLAFFPIVGNRYRVIADLGPTDGAGRSGEPALADIQALVDARGPGGLVLHDPYWLAYFHINERKVKDYGRGRVFLAGDAAHIHSPAGGQGMNTGMQDAFNLAWKLALVIRGAAKADLLASYSPERSAVGDRVLANATRMTDLATLRNPVAQAVRNLAAKVVLGLHQVQRKMSEALSETEIAYPKSPLTVEGRHAPHGHDLPRAGERCPPEAAGGLPFGAGPDPRFTVLGAGSAATALAARFPALVDAHARPPLGGDGLWLVRPDGYIGFAGAADDLAGAEAYLAAIAV
ncbi:FAD-dependent monooxygenase [Segnochrobactrum spirostomi]|uniref:FAD-binding monooxygenase n=1 Tax=Segnochrobactrum spirostomi TaxID=2608987 RepID=A0A6A7Y7W1_9HYPH|nr:FAD-dependent monooxygenase [Segnochrobactrum spirostomi]MQT14078.1 FAD-binding monooxygenase [Segnochrobactrum spirostomi]